MPKVTKPDTPHKYRKQPYPEMSPHPPLSPPSGNERPNVVVPWSPENDELLMRARQQGLNWKPIADTHFPDKSPNACRKRHERLMEKINVADSWEGAKMETLAKAYTEVREEMWRILADRIGEKWQTVEAKCMEKGVKTLQTTSRRHIPSSVINNQEIEDNTSANYRRFSQSCRCSHDDVPENVNDICIGHDPETPLATRSRDDDYQQAPYSAGGLTNTSRRSFTPNRTSSNSTTSFSLSGFTPTITTAPQFPIVTSPTSMPQSNQKLPSFSTAFSGLSSVLDRNLPGHQPSFSGTIRSPPVTTH